VRYKARRDANDGLIGRALSAAGFTVLDYASNGGVPDRLVVRPLPDGTPWVCWVEIKVEKGKLRPSQERFRQVFEPRGEFYVARDPEETVRELMDRYISAIKPEQLR